MYLLNLVGTLEMIYCD